MGFFSKLFGFNKEDNNVSIESMKDSREVNSINHNENDKFELIYNLDGFPKEYSTLISSKNGLYFAISNYEYNVKEEIVLYKCNLQLKKCEIIFKEVFDYGLSHIFDLNNNYLVYYVGNEMKILDINEMNLCYIDNYEYISDFKLASTKNIVSIHYTKGKTNDVCSGDQYIDFYNIEEAFLIKTLKQDKTVESFEMAFSYNDDYFIYSTNGQFITYVYEMKTFKCINTIDKSYVSRGIILGNNSNIMAIVRGISDIDEGPILYLYNLETSDFIKLNDKCAKDKSIDINIYISKPIYFNHNDNYLVVHGYYNDKWCSGGIPLRHNLMIYNINKSKNIKNAELIFNNLYEDNELIWSTIDKKNDLIVISEKDGVFIHKVNGSWVSDAIRIDTLKINNSKIYGYMNENMILSKSITIGQNISAGIINLSRKLILDLKQDEVVQNNKYNSMYDDDFEENWTQRDLNEYYTGDPDNSDWD